MNNSRFHIHCITKYDKYSLHLNSNNTPHFNRNSKIKKNKEKSWEKYRIDMHQERSFGLEILVPPLSRGICLLVSCGKISILYCSSKKSQSSLMFFLPMMWWSSCKVILTASGPWCDFWMSTLTIQASWWTRPNHLSIWVGLRFQDRLLYKEFWVFERVSFHLLIWVCLFSKVSPSLIIFGLFLISEMQAFFLER